MSIMDDFPEDEWEQAHATIGHAHNNDNAINAIGDHPYIAIRFVSSERGLYIPLHPYVVGELLGDLIIAAKCYGGEYREAVDRKIKELIINTAKGANAPWVGGLTRPDCTGAASPQPETTASTRENGHSSTVGNKNARTGSGSTTTVGNDSPAPK